jgi:hypothetical protein
MDLSKLREPFKASDIEWRVQSSGIKNNNPWAMVLAYVTARAVQNRLDEVFGTLGWKDTYRHVTGGVVCTLSVFDPQKKEWVEKENGSPETQIEAFKGGISKAFVRVAASGFGIGRYLYDLETSFVKHTQGGKHYDVIKDKNGKKIGEIKWNSPQLPQWALPESEKPEPIKLSPQAAGWIETGSKEIENGQSFKAYWAEHGVEIKKACGEAQAKVIHTTLSKVQENHT